jgi:hypothetical protein
MAVSLANAQMGMKTAMRKLLLASLAMSTLVCPANADTLPFLTTQISLFGTSSFGASGLTIQSANPFASTFQFGALTAFDGGVVAWRNQGNPSNTWTTGSNLYCGDCLFVGVNNGLIFTFNVLSVSAGPMIAEYFTVHSSGVASLTGFAPTEGTFSISFSLLPQVAPFGFTWVDPPPPATAPGPLAGAGLPG